MYALHRTREPSPFTALERTMDRMFGDVLGNGGARLPEFVPSLDVTETEDAYVLRAEVPGVSPDDLQITVEDATLTLGGEKKADETVPDGRRHRTERRHGRFSRTVELPHAIDPAGVEASFKHGVVTIRVPKPEKVKPRSIPVKLEE